MEVLLIDSDPDLETYLGNMIRSRIQEAKITRVNTTDDAFEYLSRTDRPAFSAILTDNRTSGGSFFRILDKLTEYEIPIIILGSDTSERAVVEAIRRGASDYVSRRSLKYERLPAILERATLDRKQQIAIQKIRREMATNLDSKALDYQILLHMEEDRMEQNRKRVSGGQIATLPDYQDGESCEAVLMYTVFGNTVSDGESIGDNVIKEKENRIRTKLEALIPVYGGKLWSRGNRFLLTALPQSNPVQAILLALEFRAVLATEVLRYEDVAPFIPMGTGISQDRLVYRKRAGDIVSSGINLAAHMAFAQIEKNGIMITGDVLGQLGKRTMNYFQREPDFEGWKVHTYQDLS